MILEKNSQIQSLKMLETYITNTRKGGIILDIELCPYETRLKKNHCKFFMIMVFLISKLKLKKDKNWLRYKILSLIYSF